MYPCQKAQELIEKYKTSDPFELCDNLGIHIIYCDLPKSIEGFFHNIFDELIIYVNHNIEEEKIDGVVAHELGHIVMHSELNTLFLKENTYLNVNKYEKEANIFSAYLIFDKFEFNENIMGLSNFLQVDFDNMAKIAKYKEQYR
ncbi:MAG: ImmA/IrrE family metallo-endopeptidase [Clostridia bacterium]